ncbi:MAG: DNA methyltransferase [Candidatus Hodarchaeales archaeon]|jgi:DNA modification methylase
MTESGYWTYPHVVHHKSYPPSYCHDLRKKHGGIKPPEICASLIEKYSDKGDSVLDPFVGAGSTLIAATITGRKAVGIDINANWRDIYVEVCKRKELEIQEYFVADSESQLEILVKDNSFQLILTDVPYWVMDKLEKTRGKFSKAGEPTREKLPSSLKIFNAEPPKELPEWLNLLTKVFEVGNKKLVCNGYLIIFIGNMYRNIGRGKKKIGKYHPLASILAERIRRLDYKQLSEITWYSPDRKLGVYGYPFVYIPSIVDQRILIFKKDTE